MRLPGLTAVRCFIVRRCVCLRDRVRLPGPAATMDPNTAAGHPTAAAARTDM